VQTSTWQHSLDHRRDASGSWPPHAWSHGPPFCRLLAESVGDLQHLWLPTKLVKHPFLVNKNVVNRKPDSRGSLWVPFAWWRRLTPTPGLSFIIWYCSKHEVFRDLSPPVCVRAERPDNGCYFHPGSRPYSIGPIEVPGSASKVGDMPPLLSRVPDVDVGLSSLDGVPGTGAGPSSSSWIEGLNKSCVNTPGGGGSRLDPSRVRVLTASLSHRRI
jgi:hypothetical protein